MRAQKSPGHAVVHEIVVSVIALSLVHLIIKVMPPNQKQTRCPGHAAVHVIVVCIVVDPVHLNMSVCIEQMRILNHFNHF